MMLVGALSVFFWRRYTGLQYRWFAAGAALWASSVVFKFTVAAMINDPVLATLKGRFSPAAFGLIGSLFTGIESSAAEMGFTLAAVLIWRRLGSNGARAIGVGAGAGAFEAVVLGVMSVGAALAAYAGDAMVQAEMAGLEAMASSTPLQVLVGPVERIVAVLCHASTRALILLGAARGKYVPVLIGFVLFTMLDGVAGVVDLAGLSDKISVWWVELALLPFGLVSLPILKRCYQEAPDAG